MGLKTEQEPPAKDDGTEIMAGDEADAGTGGPADPAVDSGVDAAISRIPEAELTPAVRRALFPLRAEREKLRAELAAARRQLHALEGLAYRDPLLGLFNRRAFMRELDRAVAMADRHDERACVVFVDVDGMKAINDAYGHQAGDAALKHVAQTLIDNVRQTDAAARLGGDEFGLILTHTDKTVAEAKAARLAELIAATPVGAGEDAFTVRVSYGAAPIEKGASVDKLIELADSAMYQYKRRKSG